MGSTCKLWQPRRLSRLARAVGCRRGLTPALGAGGTVHASDTSGDLVSICKLR